VSFPEWALPERSPVYAFNELVLEAPPERVWPWLIRAVRWPEWYGNARNVHIEGDRNDLVMGVRFDWTTFGIRAHTKIEELVPERRLSWSGRGVGATAYHGWVIAPQGTGSRVITEETQQGLVASAGRWFLRRGLLTWHQRWIEGLGTMAASGLP
jgi:hypothetical protein